QSVLEAGGRDEAGQRAVAGQHRVVDHRRSVHEELRVGEQLFERDAHGVGRVARRIEHALGEIGRRRERLAEPYRLALRKHDGVGAGAADVRCHDVLALTGRLTLLRHYRNQSSVLLSLSPRIFASFTWISRATRLVALAIRLGVGSTVWNESPAVRSLTVPSESVTFTSPSRTKLNCAESLP